MRLRLALLLLPLAALVDASGTANWEMNNYQDFLRGRFAGISLSRDGRLLLAPPFQPLYTSEQPVIWSLAQAPDGVLYAGTGHRGRIFRIDRSGKGSLLWTAEQPEVFALAVDGRGVLYAATSPNGKVYRIEKGKASEYFAPGARYIWAMVFGRDGALYVGSGDQGKIFRVTGAGSGEVYYETGQANVTCLALDAEGRLLAGTEPNGILYRITAKGKAFALYDANLPEIRTLVPAPDGTIYAAALGGSTARRATTAAAAASAAAVLAVTATSSSITVTDTQAGVDLKGRSEAAKPAPSATPAAAPLIDIAGIEKSAVYKINPDNTVETLWSSKEENVYDLILRPGELVFSTDGQGRIYRLAPDRKLTLAAQTEEGEITRLLASGPVLLAATSNQGRIYRLGPGLGSSGSYESPVHDAGTVARWGRLSWHAQVDPPCRVTFQTRTGNSLRPDTTWSDWLEPLADPEGSAIRSPNARYIQWRAALEGAPGKTPVLDSVTVAYLPQNSAPVVRSVIVTTQLAGAAAARTAPQSAPPPTYSITVTDSGDAGPAPSAGTPTQTLTRVAPPQIQISWQAEDADGDRLVYAVHFRGEEEQEWKLLKDNLTDNTLTLEAELFADGRYFFRVAASDRLANPPGAARDAELVSAPVLIDNTPPRVKAGAPKREGSRVEIDFDVADAASPLRRAEYSVDAKLWTPLDSVDGVIDSPRERFVLKLDSLAPGEHVVVFRAFDAVGNAGLAKVILR